MADKMAAVIGLVNFFCFRITNIGLSLIHI